MQDSEEFTLSQELKDDEKNDANSRFIDNGMSNHICGDKYKFIKLDEKVHDNVSFKDSSKIQILRKEKGKNVAFVVLVTMPLGWVSENDVNFVHLEVLTYKISKLELSFSNGNIIWGFFIDKKDCLLNTKNLSKPLPKPIILKT